MATPPSRVKAAVASTPQGQATTAQNPKSAAPLPFKIESTHNRQRYLNLLVYGEFGTGKTSLIGTANDVKAMGDVVMIDAESGDLSLDEYDDLDVIRVTNFAQVARVHEFLKEHCVAREKGDEGVERLAALEMRFKGLDSPPANPRKYRTVLMDSISEVETYNMYNLLSISDSTRMDDDVQGAEWAEYKKNHVAIQRMIRGYRDLPMHFLCSAAAKYTQDETKRRLYVPSLTGQLSKQVQGFMDMVGYLVVGGAAAADPSDDATLMRRLYVQPSPQGKYDAKNRFSRYKKAYFDNPTIGLILKECGLLKAAD